MTRADAKKVHKRRAKKRFIKDMLEQIAIHNSSYPSRKREWQRYAIKLARVDGNLLWHSLRT